MMDGQEATVSSLQEQQEADQQQKQQQSQQQQQQLLAYQRKFDEELEGFKKLAVKLQAQGASSDKGVSGAQLLNGPAHHHVYPVCRSSQQAVALPKRLC